MATISVYDPDTSNSYKITVDIFKAVLKAATEGKETYYFRVSTSEKDPDGATVPSQIVSAPAQDFNESVKAAILRIMDAVTGGQLMSTSSSIITYSTSSSESSSVETYSSSSSSSST